MDSSVPLVLIVFNRPELTRLLIKALRSSSPRKIYVIADAPRPENADDIKRCRQVLDEFHAIDWRCELVFQIAEENMGCRDRIVSGLDWVFSIEESAIILEDDCIPNKDFIRYCEEMLKIYSEDSNVGMISGNTYSFSAIRKQEQHYFTKFPNIWGWATWRDRWSLFEKDLQTWNLSDKKEIVSWATRNPFSLRHWVQRFEKQSKDSSVWDAQWVCALWLNHLYSVAPSKNLVANLGFGVDSTHTRGLSLFQNWPTGTLDFKKIERLIAKRNAKYDFEATMVFRIDSYLHFLRSNRLFSRMGISLTKFAIFQRNFHLRPAKSNPN